MYEKSSGKLGNCLRATKKIPAGTKVLAFDPTCTIKEQTYQTVQVGVDNHILADSFFGLLNHSCEPNLVIDTKSGVVYAFRNIYSGEELNFFYPSTEWVMSSPFTCKCHTTNCIGYIRGARWTPINILASYYLNKSPRILGDFSHELVAAYVGQNKTLYPLMSLFTLYLYKHICYNIIKGW